LSTVSSRYWSLFCALLLGVPLSVRAAEAVRVVPTVPSPLASASELIERQFSPLEAFQLQGKLAASGLKDPFHIDLAGERLLVRPPDGPGADARYGLLVFINSAKKAALDPQWINVLDAHHVVFVSPDNAGDDARMLDRRVPLALHAYEYARKTYNVDPERVYVAGRDGGARVAQRLALSYPDVFTGAIVNVGGSELGTGIPAPAPELLRHLRTRSTLVLATSRHDQPAFSEQQRLLRSLRTYCIGNSHEFDNGHTVAGHAGITGAYLSDYLDAFEAPRKPDTEGQARCEQAFQRDATAAMANIRRLEAANHHEDALKALADFDHAYGRLLLEEEVAAAKRLNPGFFGAPPTSASGAASAESH